MATRLTEITLNSGLVYHKFKFEHEHFCMRYSEEYGLWHVLWKIGGDWLSYSAVEAETLEEAVKKFKKKL